jgi:putative ABC transport system ATP-binding protein
MSSILDHPTTAERLQAPSWVVSGATTVVEAVNVTKSYGTGAAAVHALRGVSFRASRGEVTVLEGPSGSGKTTLLCVLGCILTPTSGRVRIEGRWVDAATPAGLAAVRRRSIGFVFQQFNLFSALTAVDNVRYALAVRGFRRDARARAEAAIQAVGLWHRRRHYPRDLSGGEQQRVAIARAIAADPPLLLADEPTANLDGENVRQILTLFQALVRERNQALVIVSHDSRVGSIADRTLTMRDGSLVA